MSDSLRPTGLQPTSLLCPWDSPGKNTRTSCHVLLQGISPIQDRNQVSHTACRFFTTWATREAQTKVQFSSVAQSCRNLWDPMDCSTPSFPVHHQLRERAQTPIHPVGDAIWISSSVVSFSSGLQSFPASGSFPMSYFFAIGGQSIGASASATVLPMNIQDWFPLGFTGLIFLLSKGLSRVFSNTTVQKHQFLSHGSRLIRRKVSHPFLSADLRRASF